MASRIAWEHAAKDWQEIPKGGLYKGNIKKIWYNQAVSGSTGLKTPYWMHAHTLYNVWRAGELSGAPR